MKHLSTFMALGIATMTNAQLINGSFETNGSADLQGWTTTCVVTSSNMGAPGCGNFSAQVDAGNVKGCFPGWLYQALPSVADGEIFTLETWCMNLPGFVQPVIGPMLGTHHTDQTFSYNMGPTTNSVEWSYLSVQDTFHLSQAGDVAVVILNAGTLAGPAFSQARFDGVTLVGSTSVQDQSHAEGPGLLPVRLSPDGQSVAVRTHGDAVVTMHDVQGRLLLTRSFEADQASGAWITCEVPGSSDGVLFITVNDAGGQRSARQVVIRH